LILAAMWVGTAMAAGATAAQPAQAAPAPVEGTDYFPIDSPDPVTGAKIEVVEVFGYGCPHCNAFQPHLAEWVKKLPADVHFSYLPAAFGAGAPPLCWDEFARAFFVAQTMGVAEKSHEGIYKAVWEQHRLNDDCAAIPSLFADYGPDPKVFASTMQSFAVSAKLAATHEQEVVRWGVEGTPTIVVDGTYRVAAGSGRDMLRTIDWLIARQRPLHAKRR
jgi:thiol:disulfide interchange protein DsbA